MPQQLLSPRAGRPVNILYLEVKNTSCIDYALPVLWKIKRDYPQSNVSMFYCFSDRRQVLRQSTYYSHLCESLGIREYDFADFLKPPYGWWRGWWRWLFSIASSDALSFREYLKGGRKPEASVGGNGPLGLGRQLKVLAQRRLERRFNTWMVNAERILPTFDPDIILLSNHTRTDFPGREYFYQYFDRERRPIVLLPHAPHNIDPVADFTPFDELGPAMTDYCDYWVSFQHETHWKKMCPDRVSQFPIIGYPGLDSDWLAWIMSHDASGQPRRPQTANANEPLKGIFIIRKFLPAGFVRPPNFDPFTLDYDVFFDSLKLIREAIRQAGVEIELIVKPHPSNNYPMVRDIFTASHIPRWRISHEPFYALLPECDFVISMFSTSLLIPAMAGIPTLVLNSPLQNYVHRWDKLEQLYRGLEFFVREPADLSEHLRRAFDVARARKQSGTWATSPDVKHLRRFYPDGAIERGVSRIRQLLDKHSNSELRA